MIELPEWARRGRDGWRWDGRQRPPFAEEPREGQESVWDYPRPPRLEADSRRVAVQVATPRGPVVLAETTRAIRVLETASPPTFYLPPEDVRGELLEPAAGTSRCEWKGEAEYRDVVVGERRIERAAWLYPEPFPGFERIRGYLSFYPAKVECFVDHHRVRPQPGGFYGGWVTPELVGPFKGEAGTGGW